MRVSSPAEIKTDISIYIALLSDIHEITIAKQWKSIFIYILSNKMIREF
jgi:hypothetical protein